MDLKEFLTKNEIVIPDLIFSFCQKGIKIMEKSIDPLHDANHVFRLFDDLNRFLKEEQGIRKLEVNFSVLLLAICWHDVWKSRRFPKSKISVLLGDIWDGLGSMNMFAKKARKVRIRQNLIKPVKYVMRKHSMYQIFSPKTTEAKILRDLDILDAWSLERLEFLKRKFLVPGKINPQLLRLAKFYFDYFMKRQTDSLFYFQWPKNEFRKRKKAYLREVDRLLNQHGYLL